MEVIQTEPQFKTKLSLVEVCVTTALRKGEFASPPRAPSALHRTPFMASRFSTQHVLLNNLKNRSHHRRYLWGKSKNLVWNTYSVFKTQVFRDVYSVPASTRLPTLRTRHWMTLPYSNSAVTTPTLRHFFSKISMTIVTKQYRVNFCIKLMV
jgi:hypothetical protein